MFAIQLPVGKMIAAACSKPAAPLLVLLPCPSPVPATSRLHYALKVSFNSFEVCLFL